MKITIVITDTEPGKCGVEFGFDPPIDQGDSGETPASRLALRILGDLADDILSAKVETEDDES